MIRFILGILMVFAGGVLCIHTSFILGYSITIVGAGLLVYEFERIKNKRGDENGSKRTN